jgi:hypothetical protein
VSESARGSRHDDEWLKLPGLFYRREWEQVLTPATPGKRGEDWHIEEAGTDDRGVQLYAVFHRPHAADTEESR